MNTFRRFWLNHTLINELSRFHHSQRRNEWIYLRYAKVYVRRWPTLTLASVEVYEKYQRRGFFKVILKVFEDYCYVYGYRRLIIENVHNEDLYAYLVSRNYIPKPFDPLSLMKDITQ